MSDETPITPLGTAPGIEPPPPRLNLLLLFLFLLGPAVLTCLSVMVDKGSNSPAPAVVMVGGLLGGIGCGVLLGRRLGRTPALKVLLGFVFAAICAVVSITIAMFGCLATGYQLNFR